MAQALALIIFLLCLLLPLSAHGGGTPSGTNITNQATTTYTDVSGNSYTSLSNTVTVSVSSVHSVAVTCASGQTGNLNTTVNYACTLTNKGNIKGTFTLAASSSPAWTTSLIYDANADGTRQEGETAATASATDINPEATYKFFIAVLVPVTAASGATSEATLTVTGPDTTVSTDDAMVKVTTTAQAPALVVEKKVRNVTTSGTFATSGVTAKPGNTLEYQIHVTNSGTIQAKTIVLSDLLDPNVDFLPNSLWAGADGGSSASNAHRGDNNTDDLTPCGSDNCGIASYNSGLRKVFFFLGTGATETIGGNMNKDAQVWVYYSVVVK